MFVIEPITDTIEVKAEDLTGGPIVGTIHREIDDKYPNRVVPEKGLAICRHDRTPTRIAPGICQGSNTYFSVEFSMIFFRPFVGEIIVGNIAEATSEGLRVTLGFFGAIFIPAYWMLRPSVFENQQWIWTADDERYEMMVGDEIRIRVKSLQFTKITPTAKGLVQAVTTVGRQRSSSVGRIGEEAKGVPSAMNIVASICEDGLVSLDKIAKSCHFLIFNRD